MSGWGAPSWLHRYVNLKYRLAKTGMAYILCVQGVLSDISTQDIWVISYVVGRMFAFHVAPAFMTTSSLTNGILMPWYLNEWGAAVFTMGSYLIRPGRYSSQKTAGNISSCDFIL